MYSMCNYVYTVKWVYNNKIIDTLNTSCFEFVFTISVKKTSDVAVLHVLEQHGGDPFHDDLNM